MPELYCCVDCGEELSPKGHQFSPALGGTLCDRCRPSGVAVRPMSLDALKVLRFLAKTTMPEADRLRLESELAEEVSRLLSLLLSYWPDHEIRSRRFMDHVRTDAHSRIPASCSVIPAEAGTHGPDSTATGEPVCHTSLHQTSASSPRRIKYRGVRQERPMTPRTLRVRVGDRWLTVGNRGTPPTRRCGYVSKVRPSLWRWRGSPKRPTRCAPPASPCYPRPGPPRATGPRQGTALPHASPCSRSARSPRRPRLPWPRSLRRRSHENGAKHPRPPKTARSKTVHVTPLQQVTSGEPLLELE